MFSGSEPKSEGSEIKAEGFEHKPKNILIVYVWLCFVKALEWNSNRLQRQQGPLTLETIKNHLKLSKLMKNAIFLQNSVKSLKQCFLLNQNQRKGLKITSNKSKN